MNIVELHAHDFPLLKNFADGFVPDPASSMALVAVENHEVIGRVFLMSPTHLEGPYVKEEHRGTSLALTLVKAAEYKAKEAGIKTLYAYGASAQLEDYLRRIGYVQAPLTVWKKDL